MAYSPQFNLRWHNHSFNILQVFSEQLTSESLVDVTLSCQGQFLKAHKMVLSACSTYFQDLFNVHQAQHPVIILNGMKFNDLKMVVDFMYRGETKVLESELSSLLAVAESLQVKGLTNVRDKCEKTAVEEVEAGASAGASAEKVRSSEGVDEEYISNFFADAAACDPLELPGKSAESRKPPRKRKRVSEPKNSLPKEPLPPKKVYTPKVLTQRKILSKASATRAPSKDSQSKQSLSKQSPSKESTSKQSPSKRSSQKQNHKPPPSSTSTSPLRESEQEDSEALSLVQDATKESIDHDADDDLATTIKVEPLFIRDIDDSDASWDDPTRLVIDLPLEDSDGKNDKAEGQEKRTNAAKSPKVPIKTSFVPKQLLKVSVRSVSDLVSPTSDPAQSSSTDGSSTAAKENNLALICNERRGKGGKIPRPPNAFMIFANEWRRKLAIEHPTESNKQISVRLGLKWKTLTNEKKEIYFTASRRADEEHKRKYPNYFYSPKEARLRKSQMQALRQKTHSKSPAVAVKKESADTSIDPMKFVNTYMSFSPEESSLFNADVADGAVTVKEEVMDDENDDSTQANLEEEFLKMVEEGHVEAEIEENNGETDSASGTQGDKKKEEKKERRNRNDK